MMTVGYILCISRTQYTSLNKRFPTYAPNIGLRRPTTTYPHKEEHIWPILRMNSSFTGTKDGVRTHSYVTSRLTPAASDQPQGPIITTSSQPRSRWNSTTNNRISTSTTRHHMSFLQKTRMCKSRSHSETRGRKSTRKPSPT